MGLDKTPDLARDRGAGPRAVGVDGHLRVRPGRAGRDLLRRHAPAVRLRRAPARRPRDVVLAGRVHRPLPAHARPQRLLSDGLRRQRAADRALRRADLQRRQGPHHSIRVPCALPGGDVTDRRRLRAVLAQARALGRLAAEVLDDRRPLPSYRHNSRSSISIAASACTAPRSRCSGIRRCRRRSRKRTSKRSPATRRFTTSPSARPTAATS